MKTLRVDDLTHERLGNQAQPFETEDAVINRALDALDQQVDIPASANSSDKDPERKIDPQRLPDLRFTKVLAATIGGKDVKRPKWNLLLQRMVRLAHERAKGNFNELNRLCPTNMVPGEKANDGYHYLSDINVSVQGQAANSAGQTIVTTAKTLGIALSISFMWRNKEDAPHPGERARIQTTGAQTRADAGGSQDILRFGNTNPIRERHPSE